jgi:hypothetical protein
LSPIGSQYVSAGLERLPQPFYSIPHRISRLVLR